MTPRRGAAERRPPPGCAFCGKPLKKKAFRYALTLGRFSCRACLGVPRLVPIV